MIYLHTGQPGAGKTLFTLDLVRKRAREENRPVFYAGIEILKPEEFEGWQVLEDPAKWFECPDGSIIVHDECQTLYRPRGNGAQVPEYVARFETHRHQGHDVYLITQHPMLVDSNIRRLAGEHVHVVRAFGAGMATLHKWGQVKEQCDKTRSDSVSETRAYPKALFGAYQSATVHTHKRRIPARLYGLLAIPLLLGGLAWAFGQWYDSKAAGEAFESLPTKAQHVAGVAAETPRKKAGQTREEWLQAHQPRIPGLAHTAPVYDEVTTVRAAPVPAMCVASASKCVCYTQQGTRMATPESLCRQIAETGYFLAFDPGGYPATERTAGTGAALPTPYQREQGAHVAVLDGDSGAVIRNAGTWGGVSSVGR